MKLHELPKSGDRRRTRVGRGGKRGTTSGRGTKGQKSRAGRVIRPAERDLIIRIPKRRGFRNKAVFTAPASVNLGTIARVFAKKSSGGAVAIDKETLKAAGLVQARFSGKVKVLSGGEISFPVTVRGLLVSKGAEKKIAASGGTVEK